MPKAHQCFWKLGTLSSFRNRLNAMKHRFWPVSVKTGAPDALCRSFLLGSVAVFSLSVAAAAYAGDWRATAGLGVTTSYETNPELGQNGRQSNTLRALSPSLLGAYESETYSSDIDLRTSFERSRNQNIAGDTTRFDLNVGNDLDFDTIRLFGGATFSRRSQEATEFNDAELTQDASNSSVTNDETVDDLRGSFRLEWEYSDRGNVFLSNDYRTVSFDGGGGENFRNNAAQAGINYNFNERLDIGQSFGFTRFLPEDGESANLFSIGAFGNYQVNSDALGSLSVSLLKFEDRIDYGINGQLQNQFEDAILTVGLSRDASPGDDSQLEITNRAFAGVTYDLTSVLESRLDLQWVTNEDVESQQAGVGLSYEFTTDVRTGVDVNWRESIDKADANETETTEIRVTPFVSWALSDDVDARLDYRELQRDETNLKTVRSRRVSLSVSYSRQYD